MATMDEIDLLASSDDVTTSLTLPIQLPLSNGAQLPGMFDSMASDAALFEANTHSPKFKSMHADIEFHPPQLSMSAAWSSSAISSNLSMPAVSTSLVSPPGSGKNANASAFVFSHSLSALHSSTSSLAATSSHVFDSLLSAKTEEESSLGMGISEWHVEAEVPTNDSSFPTVDPQSVANMALENDSSQDVVFTTLPGFDEVKSNSLNTLPAQSASVLSSINEGAMLSDPLHPLTEAEHAINDLLSASDSGSCSSSTNSLCDASADPLSALKSKVFSSGTQPRKKKNSAPQGPSFGRRGRRPVSEKEKQEYEARLIRESIDALTADISEQKKNEALAAAAAALPLQAGQQQQQLQQEGPAQNQDAMDTSAQQANPVPVPPAPAAAIPPVAPVNIAVEQKPSIVMEVSVPPATANGNCSEGEEIDAGAKACGSSAAAESPKKKKKNRRGKNANKSHRKRKLSSSSDESTQADTAAVAGISPAASGRSGGNKSSAEMDIADDGELELNLESFGEFKLEDCEFVTLSKSELAALTDEQRQEYKRIQRLQRNRASAQLSRERKKAYMRALEKQVRALSKVNHSLSSQLNSLSEENAKLKQKLESPATKSASSPDDSPSLLAKALEYSSSGSDNEISSPVSDCSEECRREEVDSDHAASPTTVAVTNAPPAKKAKFDLRDHPQLARMSAGLVMLSLIMAFSLFTSFGGVTVNTNTPLPANFQSPSLLMQKQFAEPAHQSRVLLSLNAAQEEEKNAEENVADAADIKVNSPVPPLSPLSDMESDDESKALALLGSAPAASAASSAQAASTAAQESESVNDMAIDIYNPNSGDSKKFFEQQQEHNLAVFKRLLSRTPLFSSAGGFANNGTKDEKATVKAAAYLFCPSAIHCAPAKAAMRSPLNESLPTVKMEANEALENDSTVRSAKRKKVFHGNERLRKLSEAANGAAANEHAVAPVVSTPSALLPAALSALSENPQAVFVLKKDDRLVLYFPSAAISEIDNSTKAEADNAQNGRREVIVEIGCLVETVTPIVLSN